MESFRSFLFAFGQAQFPYGILMVLLNPGGGEERERERESDYSQHAHSPFASSYRQTFDSLIVGRFAEKSSAATVFFEKFPDSFHLAQHAAYVSIKLRHFH